LNRGPESPSRQNLVVSWKELRDGFVSWVRARDLSLDYKRSIINNLDRFAPQLSGPLDVVKLFDGLSAGRRHCLLYSLRNLFNFCELMGFPKEFVDRLRRALPKDMVGVDNYVPSENEIVNSLRKLRRVQQKYAALYNLLLDSGLRLREAVKLTNEFSYFSGKLEFHEGFVVAPLFWFRGSKKSFYAYFTHKTLELLRNNGEKVRAMTASHYFRKRGMVPAKYIRKFVYDKMTDEELNIPDSVADFIQGRVPQSIGAKHYKKLKSQADKYYPRYAEFIKRLRRRGLGYF